MQISVNQELLQASATNPTLLEYLLDQPLDGVIDMTEIAKLAANGGPDGIEALLVVIRSGHPLEITEEILKAVWSTELNPNAWCSHSAMWQTVMVLDNVKIIIEHPTAVITENVVKESMKIRNYGLQMTHALMSHPQNAVPMTQAILEVAIQNEKSGSELLRYIFLEYAQSVEVTRSLIILASQNRGCGQEILQFLLHPACGQETPDLVEQIVTAIQAYPHGVRNALFYAANRGHEVAFKVLMETGPDLTGKSRRYRERASRCFTCRQITDSERPGIIRTDAGCLRWAIRKSSPRSPYARPYRRCAMSC